MTSTRTLAKEAALKLLQNGERPTADRIRNTIGKGAQQTILSALDEFWGEIGARLNEPRLPETLLEPMNMLWSQAVTEAGRQWQSEKSVLEERVRVLETELSEVKEALIGTQTALRQSQAEVGEAQTCISEQTERLTEQTENIRALQEELGRLTNQRDQSNELLKAEREGRERDQTAWLNEIDAARQTVKAVNIDKDRLSQAFSEARDTQVRQDLLLKHAEQASAELKTQLEARNAEFDMKSQAHEHLLAESAARLREIQRLETELTQKQNALTALEGRVQAREKDLNALMESLSTMRLQVERLSAENQILRDERESQRSNRAEIEQFFLQAMERLGEK
ncbi:DNA-binding protein [Thiorhodococcus fuscus]|uniref:DNA-binding protein n=1 Tax=Thiorhodococcus fuscus TaxID=527200 RepID=A0ABW4Y7T5_9GAMM